MQQLDYVVPLWVLEHHCKLFFLDVVLGEGMWLCDPQNCCLKKLKPCCGSVLDSEIEVHCPVFFFIFIIFLCCFWCSESGSSTQFKVCKGYLEVC